MMDDDDIKRLRLHSAGGELDLSYRDEGDGAPLLLLHGYFGSASDFRHLPDVGRGMRKIAPDLRGHARSSIPSSRFRFHDAAADVLRLLDHLAIERCSAIGLSGGALTLLRIATARPHAIRDMVLVSACDGFPAPARRFMAAFVDEASAELAALRASGQHDPARLEVLIASAKAWSSGEDDARCTQDELAAIRARTLIVAGESDPLYPTEGAERLANSLAAATLWVVPGAGHLPVFGERQAGFAARVSAFRSAAE